MHKDYSYIDKTLILGSDSVHLPEFLQHENVNFVVNLTLSKLSSTSYLKGYLWLPTPTNEAPSLDFIKQAINFIKDSQELNEKVYVHCSLGQSRAPTVVIAYYMLVHDYSFKDAYNLVKEKRPTVRLSYEQEEFLTHLKKPTFAKQV